MGGLRKGLALWRQIFTNHVIPTSFEMLIPRAGHDYVEFTVLMIGTLLLLIADLIGRKQPARQWFCDHIPYFLRLVLLAALIIITVWIGSPYLKSAGGFMYADF